MKEGLHSEATYKDTGCNLHPACLTCPLEMCQFDVFDAGDFSGQPPPRKPHRLFREMVELRRQGLSHKKISRSLAVSEGTVQRQLKHASHFGVTI